MGRFYVLVFLQFDGLHEEDDDGNMRGTGAFVNGYGQPQFQYYGCVDG